MVAGQRKIVHIDMDAFYAAVEQRDFPQYRGRPLIVGGSPDKRGVVATCSYEARKFGIHSAMSSARAHRLCPQAIFLRPRFDVYREVSRQIQSLFREYTDLVEPLSLDEAYLDLTHATSYAGSGTLVARDIKRQIRQVTNLTASAGVSYNKFLAKIASDMDKPDGLHVIAPHEGPGFVRQLPIGCFYGIGKATEARMKAAGIHTGEDLRTRPLAALQRLLGKSAVFYYQIARGIDDRPVQNQHVRKSVGAETTFDQDLDDCDTMLMYMGRLAAAVGSALERRSLGGRRLTLKVKYEDFEQTTRSLSFETPLRTTADLLPALPGLLARTAAGKRKVRLLGITVSNFIGAAESGEGAQLKLFE